MSIAGDPLRLWSSVAMTWHTIACAAAWRAATIAAVRPAR